MTGFIRVATLTPSVVLGNPFANAENLLACVDQAHECGASLLLAPELSLTGATCGDLFLTQSLLEQTTAALASLLEDLPAGITLVCGAPVQVDGRLFDCAVVLQNGRILGYVPRANLPRSATRLRCFSPAHALSSTTLPDGTPIGTDLLFAFGQLRFAVGFGTTPSPTAGAPHLLLCLDATPEGVGQTSLRRQTLSTLSHTTGCAIAYASAGAGESSTDSIYSGHRLLVWEGKTRAEALWNDGISLMDFSPAWIEARQLRTGKSTTSKQTQRLITAAFSPTESDATLAGLRANPFIPATPDAIQARCEELLTLQTEALYRRMTQIRAKRLVLGLSGGLDSTLALIVCAELCRRHNLPADTVLAVTMPGFGTTDRTYNNACTLAKTLGVELREISIVPCVTQHFTDIGHDPSCHDVTYENAQARARTWLLMDIANKEGGLLVGTGDLSEIALGWSTYNGDHMSMYAVNCSIPKTLISHCLETATHTLAAQDSPAAATLKQVLKDICDTPISPELVPGVQQTESIVGSYELHDCFLWYFLRYGCDRAQLAELAALLHSATPETERTRTLDIFCRRVIAQQFKRSCSPDGPAVGGIALSPRGGWMLPSDANLKL